MCKLQSRMRVQKSGSRLTSLMAASCSWVRAKARISDSSPASSALAARYLEKKNRGLGATAGKAPHLYQILQDWIGSPTN